MDGNDWKGLTRTNAANMSDHESIVSPIGTFKNNLRKHSMIDEQKFDGEHGQFLTFL